MNEFEVIFLSLLLFLGSCVVLGPIIIGPVVIAGPIGAIYAFIIALWVYKTI